MLGGTRGYLVVDGYTDYNSVTLPEGRVRVGCWSHVRRKFFEALASAPEAKTALDFILELYRVEHAARDSGQLGSPEHLCARRSRSAVCIERMAAWMAQQLPRHPPKNPLGLALRYARGQWTSLTRFLENAADPLAPPAEQALRTMALGRQNYLFVGNDEAGEILAGIASLLATCEANSINPEAYLADVLPRLRIHPAARLDELLPHR